ncbi:MAG: cellulase family glycosylhydrolase [Myxococcales bacterium]|nr:cellulase family glycosylhydrolase [Myxococcales bacterium]
MKHHAASLVLIASFAIGATACGDNLAAEVCGGPGVHVCKGALRDPEGRAMIPRGVNLAGAHKSAPYTDDFTQADYAQLHAWGFRAVRFLIVWAAVEPVEGRYDEAYLDWVGTRLAWAREAGLDVILDMHQDVYGEGFGFDGAPRWTCDASYYAAFVPRDPWPLNYTDANVLACIDRFMTDATLQQQFAAMWGHVAARFASEPAIIGFDPLNEPHWGTYPVAQFEQDRLMPLYDQVIAAVRAAAPWVVFAEPSSSRNLGFSTKLRPFEQADVVYAPHLYDPNAELMGTFDATHRTALLATADDLRADAERLGVPVWIGEYGGIANAPTIGAYMDAAYDGAAATLGGSMYWAMDRGGGYSIYDAQGVPVPALLDAIVRPAPVRIAGDPIAWTYDETTRVLTVTWRPDPTMTAPTVIATPARVYPTGVDVACTCAVEQGDGEVHLGGFAGPEQTAIISPH